VLLDETPPSLAASANPKPTQQVIEPTCSSPGFAWLADVFMVASQSRD
jgi:hypothetical protein